MDLQAQGARSVQRPVGARAGSFVAFTDTLRQRRAWEQTGMLSATASLGLVYLWDIDVGLTQVDKYLYSPEDMIKVPVFFFLFLLPAPATRTHAVANPPARNA